MCICRVLDCFGLNRVEKSGLVWEFEVLVFVPWHSLVRRGALALPACWWHDLPVSACRGTLSCAGRSHAVARVFAQGAGDRFSNCFDHIFWTVSPFWPPFEALGSYWDVLSYKNGFVVSGRFNCVENSKTCRFVDFYRFECVRLMYYCAICLCYVT